MEDVRTSRCISIAGPYRPRPRGFSPSGRRLYSIKTMYINISSNWGFEYIYYCVLLNLLVIYLADLLILLVGLSRCFWHLLSLHSYLQEMTLKNPCDAFVSVILGHEGCV